MLGELDAEVHRCVRLCLARAAEQNNTNKPKHVNMHSALSHPHLLFAAQSMITACKCEVLKQDAVLPLACREAHMPTLHREPRLGQLVTVADSRCSSSTCSLQAQRDSRIDVIHIWCAAYVAAAASVRPKQPKHSTQCRHLFSRPYTLNPKP